MTGFAVCSAVDSGTGCNGGGCQVIVVTSGRRCSAVRVHLVVRPLRVAQVPWIQCGIQGKEGLHQCGLRP